MRKITLLISLFLTATSFAQSNEIYGISRNNNPAITLLAKVNTTNGLINDISTTSNSQFIANFSFTVDPIEGIYYYSGINAFIGLDMNTGELVYNNPITTSQESIFQNFIYNEITQEIIGIERGDFESGVYLSKIDPTTGIVSPISTSPFADTNTITVAGAAIDMANQWYHIFSEGRLLSIDIATGAVIHNPIVDTTDFANFNNLIYNPADGNLYAIGRNSAPAELFFIQIDPITGVVTTISPTSLGEILALEGSALDPFLGVYYFKRADATDPIAIVSVDITTGEEISATPFDYSQSNGANFGYFYFGGETAQLLLSNESFSKELDINSYPNPVENILQVNGNAIAEIAVYSITGQQISTKKYTNENTIALDLSGYSAGVYFLKVFNDKNEATTLKFIKE